MAAGWDWQQQPAPYYDHGAWLASQRPQQPQQPSGVMMPQPQQRPLPQLPPLSNPQLPSMPQLPQFDTSFPSLPPPQMPPMYVPQLQTQGLGLPSYQRPQYPDQGSEYSKIGASLASMLQGYGGGGAGGGMGQVSSPINAAPVYSSAFNQGLDAGIQGQAGRSIGALPSYARGAAPALQQQYNDLSQQAAGDALARSQRGRAAASAPFDLSTQTARAGSGQQWGNQAISLYGDQQSLANQQRNSLLNMLLGGLL